LRVEERDDARREGLRAERAMLTSLSNDAALLAKSEVEKPARESSYAPVP
jgi:hypothetical protein